MPDLDPKYFPRIRIQIWNYCSSPPSTLISHSEEAEEEEEEEPTTGIFPYCFSGWLWGQHPLGSAANRTPEHYCTWKEKITLSEEIKKFAKNSNSLKFCNWKAVWKSCVFPIGISLVTHRYIWTRGKFNSLLSGRKNPKIIIEHMRISLKTIK